MKKKIRLERGDFTSEYNHILGAHPFFISSVYCEHFEKLNRKSFHVLRSHTFTFQLWLENRHDDDEFLHTYIYLYIQTNTKQMLCVLVCRSGTAYHADATQYSMLRYAQADQRWQKGRPTLKATPILSHRVESGKTIRIGSVCRLGVWG